MENKYTYLLSLAVVTLVGTASIGCYFFTQVSSDKSAILIVTVVCGTVCFLAILAVFGWQMHLESQQLSKAEKEKLAELEGRCTQLENKAKAPIEAPNTLAHEQKYKASELLQLAEKMRTKKYTLPKDDKPSVLIEEELPEQVRDFITNNFPKS